MSLLRKTLNQYSKNIYNLVKYSTNIADDSSNFIFKNNLKPEEQSKILSILNNSDKEELTQFNVSQARIKNLQNWKIKNGSFKTLNDVLEVDGLGMKALEKMCENIIQEPTTESKKPNTTRTRHKQILTPPLTENVLNNINNAIGIHLAVTGISWAKISAETNELTEWDYKNFTSLPQKMDLHETFDLAIKILQKLPSSDLYVFESNRNSTLSPSQANINPYNHQTELSSMLYALINTSRVHNQSLNRSTSEESPFENKVYHLRAAVPARLFKILMGSEKVSTIQVTSDLINTTPNLSLPCKRIGTSPQLRNIYGSLDAVNKELLGQALILAASFMELCVYKNESSWTVLKPQRKK